MNTVTLNNGIAIPVLGLGVYQIDDASLCEQIVRDALRAGYRLIDTAAAYGNEEAVGRAVKRSGVPREDIFITTKVWVQDFGYEKTKRAVAASLEKLDMAYVDLVLLHQQLSDYYGSWRALQELCRQGSVRAIGVSNFYPDRLADLCENADILPAVNQIECHPFYQRAYDLDVMNKLRVAPMAWGPFAEGGHDIWNNPVLKEIAAKHGKTVAQVALRFTLQRGVIVIPKTVHKDRLIENMAVWDFELDGEDISQIAALDTGRTEIIDHLTVDMVQFLNRHKIHE
jgi:2,5-diketo-D-gluconate reductase A